MKGKHSANAAARREWLEIERERDAALQKARQADIRLTEERDRWTKQREAMDRELAMLKVAATDAVTPVVMELRESLTKARDERDEAHRRLAAWMRYRDRFNKCLIRTLVRNFPIKIRDAASLAEEVWLLTPATAEVKEVFGWLDEWEPRTYSPAVRAAERGRLSGEQVFAIEVARGLSSKNARAGGDEGYLGPMWTSDDDQWSEEEHTALGPLTSDVARAASGDAA